MKIVVASAAAFAACALTLAAPVERTGGPAVNNNAKAHRPALVVAEPSVGGPATTSDADRDGYTATFDCNDDDPAVNPGAVESANGTDDNCNGVVDDGFDTTIDWPRIERALAIWPRATSDWRELISLDSQPRVVWVGSQFAAVWTDMGKRLRYARIGVDGQLLDGTPFTLREAAANADVAWTGRRLGVVYEDLSSGTSSVRLLTLDLGGGVLSDVVIAPVGFEPKLAWGQDRFGVVWTTQDVLNPLRFQRFDLTGLPLSRQEFFDAGGSGPAVAFSGTAVRILDERADIRDGSFGIVYESRSETGGTGEVFLTSRPRIMSASAPLGPVRVNEHDDPSTELGAMPVVSANTSGFTVCWHTVEAGLDRAQARSFALNDLAPVQEFTPDLDAGRAGRMAWTGAEFMMANDNIVGGWPAGYAVHVRRIDPSGNTHLAAGWGPWSELNLSAATGGSVSTHPDIANSGQVLGVTWVQQDAATGVNGRLWFATVTHQ